MLRLVPCSLPTERCFQYLRPKSYSAKNAPKWSFNTPRSPSTRCSPYLAHPSASSDPQTPNAASSSPPLHPCQNYPNVNPSTPTPLLKKHSPLEHDILVRRHPSPIPPLMSLRMFDRQNLPVIVRKDEFVRIEVIARNDASEVA